MARSVIRSTLKPTSLPPGATIRWIMALRPQAMSGGVYDGIGCTYDRCMEADLGPVIKVNAVSEMRSFRNLKSAVTFMTLHFASGATGVFSTLFQTIQSGSQGFNQSRLRFVTSAA